MLNKGIEQFFTEVMAHYPNYILEYTEATTHDNIIAYQQNINKNNTISIIFTYKSCINCLDCLIINVTYIKNNKLVMSLDKINYIDNPKSIDINNINYNDIINRIDIEEVIADIDNCIISIKKINKL